MLLEGCSQGLQPCVQCPGNTYRQRTELTPSSRVRCALLLFLSSLVQILSKNCQITLEIEFLFTTAEKAGGYQEVPDLIHRDSPPSAKGRLWSLCSSSPQLLCWDCQFEVIVVVLCDTKTFWKLDLHELISSNVALESHWLEKKDFGHYLPVFKLVVFRLQFSVSPIPCPLLLIAISPKQHWVS